LGGGGGGGGLMVVVVGGAGSAWRVLEQGREENSA